MASVLLVEDDFEVADIIAEVLTDFGHSVHRAADGGAALAIIDAGLCPDVVVTDVTMPGGLGGLALADALHTRSPALPVVLATGHSERAAELRAAGFLVLRKPFHAAEMEAVLRRALQGMAP